MTIILIDDFHAVFDTLCTNANKFLGVPWQPPKREKLYEEFRARSDDPTIGEEELVIKWFKTGETFFQWLSEGTEKLNDVSMILLDESLGYENIVGQEIYNRLKQIGFDHLVCGISAERTPQEYLPQERYLGMASVLIPSWIGLTYRDHTGTELH